LQFKPAQDYEDRAQTRKHALGHTGARTNNRTHATRAGYIHARMRTPKAERKPKRQKAEHRSVAEMEMAVDKEADTDQHQMSIKSGAGQAPTHLDRYAAHTRRNPDTQ
jgi:hypothetical protein